MVDVVWGLEAQSTCKTTSCRLLVATGTKKSTNGSFVLLEDQVNVPLLGGNRDGSGKRLNRYKGTVLEALLENHLAVDQGEKGVVLAHAYVNAWVVLGTALTHNNVACYGSLPTEDFYA
jgi:hypothetical protein